MKELISFLADVFKITSNIIIDATTHRTALAIQQSENIVKGFAGSICIHLLGTKIKGFISDMVESGMDYIMQYTEGEEALETGQENIVIGGVSKDIEA